MTYIILVKKKSGSICWMLTRGANKRGERMYQRWYAGSFRFPAGVSLQNHATPPAHLGW